jgi:hypothetical protein
MRAKRTAEQRPGDQPPPSMQRDESEQKDEQHHEQQPLPVLVAATAKKGRVQCSESGCSFSGTAANLRVHTRIHSGERPFPCRMPGTSAGVFLAHSQIDLTRCEIYPCSIVQLPNFLGRMFVCSADVARSQNPPIHTHQDASTQVYTR